MQGFESLPNKMNDLMTNSFVSYVELKKQAERDLITENKDVEKGNNFDEKNLSQFFEQVDPIKSEMEEINSLLIDLQNLNEESKSTHSAKVLRGLRDRMDADVALVLRKVKIVKSKLDCLDRSNASKGESAIDRTKGSVTNGLKIKLRELMNDFQTLRHMIITDHKEYLKRRYYNATGEVASDEVVEKLASGGLKLDIFEGKTELVLENKERHEAVIDIQKSLDNLHQVFLDMAVLVEAQGEKIDDIEQNVARAGSYVSGGTNSLFYAKQMKKGGKKWVFWVWFVGFIILLVCVIAMVSS